MSASITALLLFAGWTLLLPVIQVAYRGLQFMMGKQPINAWPRDRENTDPVFLKRCADAHLNALENLPIFGAIVLAAAAIDQLSVINGLAMFVFYARVGQTLAHLINTGQIGVFVRATFYLIQVGIMAWMLLGLLCT